MIVKNAMEQEGAHIIKYVENVIFLKMINVLILLSKIKNGEKKQRKNQMHVRLIKEK